MLTGRLIKGTPDRAMVEHICDRMSPVATFRLGHLTDRVPMYSPLLTHSVRYHTSILAPHLSYRHCWDADIRLNHISRPECRNSVCRIAHTAGMMWPMMRLCACHSRRSPPLMSRRLGAQVHSVTGAPRKWIGLQRHRTSLSPLNVRRSRDKAAIGHTP